MRLWSRGWAVAKTMPWIGLGVLAFLSPAPVGAQTLSGAAAQGERVFKEQGCYGCHMVGKFGTPIGPDLSKVGAKRDLAYLTKWLHDPASQKPTAHMPKIQLHEREVRALAAYLAAQR
ncbi:MAG TPA: c-type cytochrome [Candidatus Limnocylindrales bacterium]|nr:c-type cytochrome [Candidatus Limnocylindrales bacterium]